MPPRRLLPAQQLRPLASQRRLHPRQGGQRHIDRAGLDLLHRPGIEAHLLGELLLREMSAHALPAHIGAETLEEGGLIV